MHGYGREAACTMTVNGLIVGRSGDAMSHDYWYRTTSVLYLYIRTYHLFVHVLCVSVRFFVFLYEKIFCVRMSMYRGMHI